MTAFEDREAIDARLVVLGDAAIDAELRALGRDVRLAGFQVCRKRRTISSAYGCPTGGG
jgi:hypothetical protein